jgi:hypothetical protein
MHCKTYRQACSNLHSTRLCCAWCVVLSIMADQDRSWHSSQVAACAPLSCLLGLVAAAAPVWQLLSACVASAGYSASTHLLHSSVHACASPPPARGCRAECVSGMVGCLSQVQQCIAIAASQQTCSCWLAEPAQEPFPGGFSKSPPNSVAAGPGVHQHARLGCLHLLSFVLVL